MQYRYFLDQSKALRFASHVRHLTMYGVAVIGWTDGRTEVRLWRL